jgi:hypothetical protein
MDVGGDVAEYIKLARVTRLSGNQELRRARVWRRAVR